MSDTPGSASRLVPGDSLDAGGGKVHLKWDRGMVDSQVFAHHSTVTTSLSAFDAKSIMLYPVPAGLTLDGWSQGSNRNLSATDKQYATRWYPFTPTPANATGQLRTGDGDLIDFTVEYGVAAVDQVEFVLNLSGGLTGWKAIEIPMGNTYAMLWVQDNTTRATVTIPVTSVDIARRIRFWKAKFLGAHTLLPYGWDVFAALPGGSRVTLDWVQD